jgi:MFS transporter, DHA2 family, multidrug resistance protein
MPLIYPRRLRGWRFTLFNSVLGFGHIVVLSNAGGYTAVGPHAAGDLGGVLPTWGAWGTTYFMAGVTAGFAIARWLAGRYGDYRVFIAAFAVFGLASFVCAISETVWLFMPARILLGFSAAITVPLGQALGLNEFPERKRALGLGIWGMFTLMPFTIGIPLGGWFAEHVGWRYLFYSNIVDALIVASVTGALLYGRGFHRRTTRFDGGGFFFLVLTIMGTQTILNMGNDFDWFGWSWFLFGLLIAVIISFVCFIIWELGERHPALDIRLFVHRNYAIAMICSLLGFLSIQGLVSLMTGQLQVLLGYSSSLAGLVFLAMILLSLPTIVIAHKLCEGHDARFVACLNLLGLALIMFWIGIFDDPSYFDQIFWPFLLLGFFLATFFAPLGVLALHGMPGRQLLNAAEEFAIVRVAAGGFGISLQQVVQFRRLPFHQLDLADHFGGRRFASLDLLSQLSDKLRTAGLTAAQTTGALGSLIRDKSALLGMNDAFLLASAVFLFLAALVWLARPTHVVYVSRAEELRELRAEELTEQP